MRKLEERTSVSNNLLLKIRIEQIITYGRFPRPSNAHTLHLHNLQKLRENSSQEKCENWMQQLELLACTASTASKLEWVKEKEEHYFSCKTWLGLSTYVRRRTNGNVKKVVGEERRKRT
jgi:hypothetical protein